MRNENKNILERGFIQRTLSYYNKNIPKEVNVLSRFFDLEHFIHSVKTVIACLLGLMLSRTVGLPADQWVVITIIVVMCAQIYVGSVMQKAYLRFLGTLIGCLFAAFTLLFLGDTPLALATAISLSSFIFSYLATKYENFTYAGTLGAVTTAIIMLGQHPTLIVALERFLEISLGVLIAALVSQFVLPIHARTHLRYAQATTLRQLRNYYQDTMDNMQGKEKTLHYQELDESIVKSLLKQRQLAKESLGERLGLGFSKEYFVQSLYYEREILRAMTFMHHAITHVQKAALLFLQTPAGKEFNAGILSSLAILIKVIESDEFEPAPLHIPTIEAFKKELNEHNDNFAQEERIYVDGFLFSAEILANGIAKLASVYGLPIANLPKINQNLAP